MNSIRLNESPALWLGLRQAEAIRESLRSTLNGQPLPNQRMGKTAIEGMRNWLSNQNVPIQEDCPDAPLLATTLDAGFETLVGTFPGMLVRGSDSPADGWIGLGAERSGAGYVDPANFIITSAFVRLLGASEQFELDVLKTLIHYRPSGMFGDYSEAILIKAEPEIIAEKPDVDEQDSNKSCYRKTPLWTWMKGQAENNIERAKIFKNVFDISVIPENYKSKQKKDWYDKRNAIAHGRAGVKMTLGEYIEVDAFVANSMLSISAQCLMKLKVML